MNNPPNPEEPQRKKPTFKVVATLVRAANRFKNSFNVEYDPAGSKKRQGHGDSTAVNHRGAKAALILGTVSEHNKQVERRYVHI